MTAPAWVQDVTSTLPAMMTTDETARLLRLSRRQLYRLISGRKLSAVKRGKAVLVPRVAVVAYLSELEAA